ncbi:MAG: hypothetical protein CM15mP14_2740 [Rhodospirillaceae bacterium]|nr:MAG: hypothetical protein CM15mP14_2740 [Rhodospirillaceae bacterium]
MSNPFREKLNKGQVLGVLTSMPSTIGPKNLSNSGFDWLFIDMEHGAIDIASCYNMITERQVVVFASCSRMDPSIVFTKPVLARGQWELYFP